MAGQGRVGGAEKVAAWSRRALLAILGLAVAFLAGCVVNPVPTPGSEASVKNGDNNGLAQDAAAYDASPAAGDSGVGAGGSADASGGDAGRSGDDALDMSDAATPDDATPGDVAAGDATSPDVAGDGTSATDGD